MERGRLGCRNSEIAMKQFMFVVVLHEMSMLESPTIRSLFRQRTLFRERGIRLLVIDNTPGKKPKSLAIDNETEYVSLGANTGLANAYQVAFLMAKADNYHFLVLFDQDSEVDSSFITALDGVAGEHLASVGIWCPDIISGGRRISPYSSNAFGWPNYSPPNDARRIYGINSFSVVNVRLIDEIGGFDQFYWLDCLDSWLYESAQRHGWSVKRLDATVKHDLSLVSGKISLTRMKNIAFYESCFVVEHGPIVRIAGAILRLTMRGLKRWRVIGGIRNYGSYFFAIGRGIHSGLKRRQNRTRARA
jgi:GT2 family glycosyltransferase